MENKQALPGTWNPLLSVQALIDSTEPGSPQTGFRPTAWCYNPGIAVSFASASLTMWIRLADSEIQASPIRLQCC